MRGADGLALAQGVINNSELGLTRVEPEKLQLRTTQGYVRYAAKPKWGDVAGHRGFEQRACRFGGQRPFFHCPHCAQSVLNLHLSGGRFSCRECARLTYASRRERARDRNLRAANKLRARLGGEAGALNDIAARPKGMWRTSYDRIVGEIERREANAFEELAGWLMNRGGRLGRRATTFWT